MSWTTIDEIDEVDFESHDIIVRSGELNVCALGSAIPFLVEIIPRRSISIFVTLPFLDSTRDAEIHGDQIRDRLPYFRRASESAFSLDTARSIKAIESRMYLDLASQVGGQWWAQKKMSIICLYRRPNGRYQPVVNVPITITRTPNDSNLQFVQLNNTFGVDLTGTNRPQTNNQGIAEFTIAHPTQAVPDNQRTVTIRAVVEIPRLGIDGRSTTTSKIIVRQKYDIILVRNDRITNIADIYDEPADPNSANELWIYQPVNLDVLNNGIRDLQEAINEVVSRHRGINNFDWIHLNGIFDDRTRNAIRQYLENFNTVNAGYPYNLTNIGPDNDLLTYIREDYAPYDPTINVNRGRIVDRRLLIGQQRDMTPNQIDGLLELKEGVVDILKAEMVRVANDYTANCNTFWLHRPIHNPYQAAVNFVFRITANNVQVKVAPPPQPPAPPPANLLDGAGNAVIVSAGELFPSQQVIGAWTQITHPAGIGWLPSSSGRRIADDQSIPRNSGLHGGNGVAYSLGCKDLPAVFVARLNNNPNALPNNVGGNRPRIAHWGEYGDGYRVGRATTDQAWAQPGQPLPPNGIQNHTGCDCNGLVQNCITQAAFPDGTRIVLNTLTRAIAITANRTPLNSNIVNSWVGPALGSVPGDTTPLGHGNNARLVPMPGGAAPHNDAQLHWMRQGDIIQNPNHVVFVAGPIPNAADPKPNALGANSTFEVFNEYGCVNHFLIGPGAPVVDPNRFLRKAISMPFYYWGIQLNGQGVSIGKIYIWS